MGRTIAVTGVSGYLGKTLLGLLERHPDVDHVIGLDTREIPIRTPKLEFHTFDVLDPGLPKMIAGADTLVHLAFVVDPMRDEGLMHAVNVGGFRCVLDAVDEAGVSRFVYPSSGWAYGAHPDNPVQIPESAPLRPNTGFSYAEHKAETEAVLGRWSRDHSEVAVAVLRPATTIGPHVANFMSRALEGPRLPAIRDHAPALQFLHEDDFAEALVHFALGTQIGTYNVCADGGLEHAELLALVGRGELAVPAALAYPLAEVGWKLGLTEVPAGALDLLVHPCVLDNSAASEAGWRPRHTNSETVAETIRSLGDHVSIGTVRLTRAGYGRALRVLAVAGLAGLTLALVAALRRR
ncbi:MAG: NAD-dependent epimerase/dehydratase family protein [Acidimicrobiia bacterium]